MILNLLLCWVLTAMESVHLLLKGNFSDHSTLLASKAFIRGDYPWLSMSVASCLLDIKDCLLELHLSMSLALPERVGMLPPYHPGCWPSTKMKLCPLLFSHFPLGEYVQGQRFLTYPHLSHICLPDLSFQGSGQPDEPTLHSTLLTTHCLLSSDGGLLLLLHLLQAFLHCQRLDHIIILILPL